MKNTYKLVILVLFCIIASCKIANTKAYRNSDTDNEVLLYMTNGLELDLKSIIENKPIDLPLHIIVSTSCRPKNILVKVSQKDVSDVKYVNNYMCNVKGYEKKYTLTVEGYTVIKIPKTLKSFILEISLDNQTYRSIPIIPDMEQISSIDPDHRIAE